MDAKILGWARRVKARDADAPPPLWLFTDRVRLADPLPVIARLPPRLAGIVLRPDGVAGAAGLGLAIAALCRSRRLALSVAGDWRLAARLRGGLHLRGGRLPGPVPRNLPRLTGSAHNAAELLRCRRAGVALAFVSPVFPTASHPGRSGIGVVRFAALTRRAAPLRAAALGGLNAGRVASLPSGCRAIGAIGLFSAATEIRCKPATVFRDCHVAAPEMVARL